MAGCPWPSPGLLLVWLLLGKSVTWWSPWSACGFLEWWSTSSLSLTSYPLRRNWVSFWPSNNISSGKDIVSLSPAAAPCFLHITDLWAPSKEPQELIVLLWPLFVYLAFPERLVASSAFFPSCLFYHVDRRGGGGLMIVAGRTALLALWWGLGWGGAWPSTQW